MKLQNLTRAAKGLGVCLLALATVLIAGCGGSNSSSSSDSNLTPQQRFIQQIQLNDPPGDVSLIVVVSAANAPATYPIIPGDFTLTASQGPAPVFSSSSTNGGVFWAYIPVTSPATTVAMVPTANTGNNWAFSAWGGSCSSLSTPYACTATMSTDQVYVAVFNDTAMTVTEMGDGNASISVTAGGTALGLPATSAYPYYVWSVPPEAGQQVIVTAQASASQYFLGWNFAIPPLAWSAASTAQYCKVNNPGQLGNSGSCTFNAGVNYQNAQLTATFSNVNPYAVTVIAPGTGVGTISYTGAASGTNVPFAGTPPTVLIPLAAAATSVDLTATAGLNSVFTGWSACSGTNDCVAYAGHSVIAEFQGFGVSGIVYGSTTVSGYPVVLDLDQGATQLAQVTVITTPATTLPPTYAVYPFNFNNAATPPTLAQGTTYTVAVDPSTGPRISCTVANGGSVTTPYFAGNAACTAGGAPVPCCTGTKTGNCTSNPASINVICEP